jgi:hypothetical protein
MKRLLVVPVLMMLVIFLTANSIGPAAAITNVHRPPKAKPIPAPCKVQSFRSFATKVWDLRKWERGTPPKFVLEAYAKRLSCAPPAHAKVMKATWHRDQAIYFKKRHSLMWREHYKPFVYPDGTRWAVPYPIAICESGENYYASSAGAYGLIFTSWLPPKRQDEVAHNLYMRQGEGPWAPYESSCYLR